MAGVRIAPDYEVVLQVAERARQSDTAGAPASGLGIAPGSRPRSCSRWPGNLAAYGDLHAAWGRAKAGPLAGVIQPPAEGKQRRRRNRSPRQRRENG